MTWLPFTVLGLALVVVIVLGYTRGWRWTGVAEVRTTKAEAEELQPAKTLWDWLQLLVIPVALAVLAVLLNSWQTDREQEREDQRAKLQRRTANDAAREEALRAYLTQMSDLMLDRDLLRPRPGRDARVVARTLTLTVLRRLDGEGRASVVRFLWEGGLLKPIDSPDCEKLVRESGRPGFFRCARRVEMDGANLRSADFRGVRMPEVDIEEADLRGADLRRASLLGADLFKADLRGADLRRAFLAGAIFQSAKLQGADLREAFLQSADLRAADLRRAILSRAFLESSKLKGADLRGAKYDSETSWPPGFDPGAAGAKEVKD